jgi:hypothetical protein
MTPSHPDFEILTAIADEMRRRLGMNAETVLGTVVQDAMEFVLDPIRTGRTELYQVDNVEKTFIGLKVEHFLRDKLDAPKGIRDLHLVGYDVDVKHTLSPWGWMIPPETYLREEPCVLISTNEQRRVTHIGLIIARDAYLNASTNRDRKRGIQARSRQNIMWLSRDIALPPNRWAGIDMDRFRELRKVTGGSTRAAIFFSENLRIPIHRDVILALLHDQLDAMKRLRSNQGAKNILRPRGIALLSGVFFNSVLEQLGLPRIDNDQHIAIKPSNESEVNILRAAGEID